MDTSSAFHEPVALSELTQPLQSLLLGKTNRPYFRISNGGERVPWSTSAEWCEFFELLFSNDPANLKQAVAIKNVWTTRGLGIRSAVYDLTCSLRRLLAIDPPHDESHKGDLAFQVIRFVSLITDQVGGHRDRDENTRSSMKKALASYGVSDDIIALRHTITHNTEQTTISECVLCCSMILKWIIEVYWTYEHAFHKSVLNAGCYEQTEVSFPLSDVFEDAAVQQVEELLDEYSRLFDAGKTLPVAENDIDQQNRLRMDEIIDQLHSLNTKSPEHCLVMCSALISQRYMLPDRTEWNTYFSTHYNELLAERQKCSLTHFLPEVTVAKWSFLITKVVAVSKKTLNHFLITLCNRITEKEVTDNIMLSTAEWMRFIMQKLQITNVGENSRRFSKKRRRMNNAALTEQSIWEAAAVSFELQWPAYYRLLCRHANANVVRLAEDIKFIYLSNNAEDHVSLTGQYDESEQNQSSQGWQTPAEFLTSDCIEAGFTEQSASSALPQLGRCAEQPIMQLHNYLKIS